MMALHLGRKRIVFVLVEQNLELLGILVEALKHADLRHILEAEGAVGGGIVELRPVEEAAVQGRHDLGAGQRIHRAAHGGVHVNGKPHGTELHTFEVFKLADRLLEPAKRLRRHRSVEERNNVCADGCVELRMELLAAAVFVPREQHVGVHAVGRARPKQSQGILLAVVVNDHAVGAVERALGHCVQHAEGRHHGACRAAPRS